MPKLIRLSRLLLLKKLRSCIKAEDFELNRLEKLLAQLELEKEDLNFVQLYYYMQTIWRTRKVALHQLKKDVDDFQQKETPRES